MISNKEIEDAMKIVKLFEESGLTKKGAGEVIGRKAKEKSGLLRMLLSTFSASLLRNLLASKGESILKYKDIIRISPKLIVFIGEIIDDRMMRDDRTYIIKLDECKSIGTHWIALYVNGI